MLEFDLKKECIFRASFLEAGTCVLHACLQPKCQFLAKNLSIPGVGGGYHICIYIYIYTCVCVYTHTHTRARERVHTCTYV